MNIDIRAIVYSEAGVWVAQCLEYDIGAEAPTFVELQARLNETLNVELRESMERTGKPFGGLDPAPEYFQKLWAEKAGTFPPVQGSTTRQIDGSQVSLEMELLAA